MTATMLRHRVANRWNSLKYLDDNSKIDLITLLTQSLRPARKKCVSASRFYGVWGDDGMTDEEFVEFLRKERAFQEFSGY